MYLAIVSICVFLKATDPLVFKYKIINYVNIYLLFSSFSTARTISSLLYRTLIQVIWADIQLRATAFISIQNHFLWPDVFFNWWPLCLRTSSISEQSELLWFVYILIYYIQISYSFFYRFVPKLNRGNCHIMLWALNSGRIIWLLITTYTVRLLIRYWTPVRYLYNKDTTHKVALRTK